MSITLGSSILEKHICYTRAKGTYDYHSALLKNEFKKFVNHARIVEKSVGKKFLKIFSKSEKRYRSFQKKSITLVKKKNSGEKIKLEDIAFLRTNNLGKSPHKLKYILNRKLKSNLQPYSPIKFKYLK